MVYFQVRFVSFRKCKYVNHGKSIQGNLSFSNVPRLMEFFTVSEVIKRNTPLPAENMPLGFDGFKLRVAWAMLGPVKGSENLIFYPSSRVFFVFLVVSCLC